MHAIVIYMLPKRERLTREEFEHYRTDAKRFEKHTDAMRVVMVDDVRIFFKVSVVVSKKAIKGAVIRHLIKRRIYSWFNTNRMNVAQNRAYMIHIKKTNTPLTYAYLDSMLREVCFETSRKSP